MKPVSLNQLLFHQKKSALSFFIPQQYVEVDHFIQDMKEQLLLQNLSGMAKILEKSRTAIKKIINGHQNKSHGFFISEDLQGHVILETQVDVFCIIAETFHVRPLLEEVFVNPEFLLVNVSYYDIKVYRGDFQNLEILRFFDFDQMEKGISPEERSRLFTPGHIGLVPYKKILTIKNIAKEVKDLSLYYSLPVIVIGLSEMKDVFLRYYRDDLGLISHFNEDFFEKTTSEILPKCKQFRYAVIDYYSAQLKEKLKNMLKSQRVASELNEVIEATRKRLVLRLIIPTQTKIWGTINLDDGIFEIHRKLQKRPPSVDILNELAERVIKDGGRVQVLPPHFFPQNTSVMAILRS